MAMQDLITGGAACSVPGAPSFSSNLLGALADSILGTSSKQVFFNSTLLCDLSAGSVQENAGPINHVKEPKPANIIMGSKEELLGTFSVYNHRSLHQLKQAQHKVNQNNVMKEEVKQLFNKGKKPDMKRTRLKKKSFHRKARILDTH